MPLTSQVIWGLSTPVTMAVNCCVEPARTFMVAGEMVMVWAAGPVGGSVGLLEPANPAQLTVSPMDTMTNRRVR